VAKRGLSRGPTQLAHNMARLRPRDLEALTGALEKLTVLAATIEVVKSPWAGTAIQQVRDIYNVVLEIRDRGLTKMQRVLGKIGDQLDQEARAKAAAEEKADDEQ
jgi:uncharacterized protein YukE